MAQQKQAEEGDACPNAGCDGKLELSTVEGCSCHISPSCTACTNNAPKCDTCGWAKGSQVTEAPCSS